MYVGGARGGLEGRGMGERWALNPSSLGGGVGQKRVYPSSGGSGAGGDAKAFVGKAGGGRGALSLRRGRGEERVYGRWLGRGKVGSSP